MELKSSAPDSMLGVLEGWDGHSQVFNVIAPCVNIFVFYRGRLLQIRAAATYVPKEMSSSDEASKQHV